MRLCCLLCCTLTKRIAELRSCSFALGGAGLATWSKRQPKMICENL